MSPTSSTSDTGRRSTSRTASSSSASASCFSRSSLQIVLRVRVPDDVAGARLDAFVATHGGSRAAAERAIAAGVVVDGATRAKAWRVQGGEEMELESPAPAQPLQREERELRLAYE